MIGFLLYVTNILMYISYYYRYYKCMYYVCMYCMYVCIPMYNLKHECCSISLPGGFRHLSASDGAVLHCHHHSDMEGLPTCYLSTTNVCMYVCTMLSVIILTDKQSDGGNYSVQ